jgi:hypothetical protein
MPSYAYSPKCLQRQSKWLNRSTVAAVLEEAAGVLSTERRDRRAHRLEQGLSGTRLGFAHEALLLAKDPEQRPARAKAVSRALDPSVLAHEDAKEETAVLALPAAARRRRRQRRPLVAAVLLCISLLEGLTTLADGSGGLRWVHLRSLVFWQEESAVRLSIPHVPARRAAPDPPTNSKPAAEYDIVPSVGRMVREVQKGIEEAIPGFSFDDAAA